MRYLGLSGAVALVALACSPAHALFKVLGPDGRVTYTDRAPASEPSQPPSSVQAFKPGHGEAQANELPYELRQTTKRYPVTLYSSQDCAPCDNARQWLVQRGVPFQERLLLSEEDGKAFDRLNAGRSVPGLAIGKQQLRGLNPLEWASYLDAAGYPKESRLPSGWKRAEATPLTKPAAAAQLPSTASSPGQPAEAAPAAPAIRRHAGPANQRVPAVTASALDAPVPGLRF